MSEISKDWLSELSKAQGVTTDKNWLECGYTYHGLQNADLPAPEWLIGSLIPNPGLIAVTGRPGHYKTFFVQWLCMRLGAGLPLFDNAPDTHFCRAYKESVGIVFIEEEMNAVVLKERTNDMRSWPVDNFHWFISTGFNLKDKTKVSELRKFIEDNNIKILVLDPFTTVATMKDENSNSEAREVMDILRHEFVDTKHGCTVIFIHHPAKGEGTSENIRGAGDILGKCDMHYVLAKQSDDKDERKIDVKCKKSRFKESPCFAVEIFEGSDLGRLEWRYLGDELVKYKQERDELKEDVLGAMKMSIEYTQSQVAEMVNQKHNNKQFRSVWDQLLKDEKIEQINRYKWVKIA